MHRHLTIDRQDLHLLSSTSRSVHGEEHEKEHTHISLSTRRLGDEPSILNEVEWYCVSIYVISKMDQV